MRPRRGGRSAARREGGPRTIATRECFSSAARYQARVSADAIFERPIGSKTLPPVSGPVPSLRAGAAGTSAWSGNVQASEHLCAASHIGDAHANAGGSGWRDARRERRAVEGDAVDGEGEHGYLGSWRQSVRPLE